MISRSVLLCFGLLCLISILQATDSTKDKVNMDGTGETETQATEDEVKERDRRWFGWRGLGWGGYGWGGYGWGGYGWGGYGWGYPYYGWYGKRNANKTDHGHKLTIGSKHESSTHETIKRAANIEDEDQTGEETDRAARWVAAGRPGGYYRYPVHYGKRNADSGTFESEENTKTKRQYGGYRGDNFNNNNGGEYGGDNFNNNNAGANRGNNFNNNNAGR